MATLVSSLLILSRPNFPFALFFTTSEIYHAPDSETPLLLRSYHGGRLNTCGPGISIQTRPSSAEELRCYDFLCWSHGCILPHHVHFCPSQAAMR
jgi:hypothetical protein